jgi:hypothetical protein
MSLSPELRDQLILATREAAVAFLEDMPHIRDVLNRPNPDRGELRRLSSVLRRLLIDNGGDIRDIAAPRIGRFVLLSPDNKPVFKAARKTTYDFFASAGVLAFGIHFRAAAFEKGTKPTPLENFDPDRTVELPMDNFLSQDVLCFQGRWITRRDAIKYIANIASGVHSGRPKDEKEKTIARIRKSASFSAIPGAPNVQFNVDSLFPAEPPFQYLPNAVDPVLLEMLAAAHYLELSPDIRRLEELVKTELGVLAQSASVARIE